MRPLAMGRLSSSILVSVLLSAVVLGVFYTHQWYGPVGTIQRFLYCLLRGDTTTAATLAIPPRAVALPQQLRSTSGIDLQLLEVDEKRGLALVRTTILLKEPIPHRTISVWLLRRTPQGWKVDLSGTEGGS